MGGGRGGTGAAPPVLTALSRRRVAARGAGGELEERVLLVGRKASLLQQQRIEVSLQRRQRRAQVVRDVGHELAAEAIDLLQLLDLLPAGDGGEEDQSCDEREERRGDGDHRALLQDPARAELLEDRVELLPAEDHVEVAVVDARGGEDLLPRDVARIVAEDRQAIA